MDNMPMCVLVAQSCPTLWDPMNCTSRFLCPWNSPGKNSGVGCHSLLQDPWVLQGFPKLRISTYLPLFFHGWLFILQTLAGLKYHPLRENFSEPLIRNSVMAPLNTTFVLARIIYTDLFTGLFTCLLSVCSINYKLQGMGKFVFFIHPQIFSI